MQVKVILSRIILVLDPGRQNTNQNPMPTAAAKPNHPATATQFGQQLGMEDMDHPIV
jgi:hypothetical protein